MDLPAIFGKAAVRAAAVALKRPPVVIFVVGAIALLATLSALKLQPDTGVESITGNDSATYEATRKWAEQFGGDPVVVLVRGDLAAMVLGPDLGRMLGLEGCLSGNIPRAAQTSFVTPEVCKRLGEFKPAVAVHGPGTFVATAARTVNEGIQKILKRAERAGEEAAAAAAEIARRQGKPPAEQQEAAGAAQELARLQALRDSLVLGQQYGLSAGNLPSIDNPAFVTQLVFDPARGSKTPKSRFQYLFPNSRSAVIQVRLRPDLTPAQQAEAVDLVRRAVAVERFQLDNGSYTVTGAPVVLNDSQEAIESAMIRLLIGALIVMALVLFVVFPAELRLLPLALALMAAGITYGLLALTGSKIGVGAVAVLPVLTGLAVDYAIQFHARADRAMREGVDAPRAVRQAAAAAGPPVLAAALATVAALLALALSPVPLVRGFGLLLVCGVALSLAIVMTAGFAVLGWAGGVAKNRPRRDPAERAARLLRARQALTAVSRRPRRTLAVAGVLAALGWVAALLSPVAADVSLMIPGGSQSGKDIRALQKITGSAGEIDVLVRARNVTDPKVIEWMRDYQDDVLARAGYKGERPTCEKASLCPASSLASLFNDRQQEITKESVRRLLDSVGDFANGVVTPGRRMSTMAFGVRLQSLGEQQKVIRMMRDRLNPPKGVTAEVVGLTALAADAGAALGNPARRALISGAALLMLFLVVLAITRSVRRALPPAVTVLLAAGLSALLLFVARVELNPMSAALAVFVIAIAGEFTLLIYVRYLREREKDAGLSDSGAVVEAVETDRTADNIGRAYRRAYRGTGPAVFASGVTAIAGFAVLALADINMLRGFAVVAVVDLTVALAGALLLLPAVTLWLEEDETAG